MINNKCVKVNGGPDRSHDQRPTLGKGQDTEGGNMYVCV